MTTDHPEIAGFLQELQRRSVSENTTRNYRLDLQLFAKWFEVSNGEAFAAAAVTPTDIRGFRSHQQTVRKLKPATINRRLASLRSFFECARGQGLVSINPASDVPLVVQQQLAPKSLTRVELNRLTREAEKDALAGRHLGARNLAIIQTLRYTGLRVQELCDVTLDDLEISERKGQLTVRSGKRADRRTHLRLPPAHRSTGGSSCRVRGGMPFGSHHIAFRSS